MKIPDIAGEYTKVSFDYDAQDEYRTYINIGIDGNIIDFYMSEYDPFDAKERITKFKGKIVAASEKMKVVKILKENDELIWYDYEEHSLYSYRMDGYVYLKVQEFEFNDFYLNKVLELINYVISDIVGESVHFNLTSGYEKIKNFRQTNENNNYRIDIFNYNERCEFRLATLLEKIFTLEVGVFHSNKHVYFKTQWLSEKHRAKIREKVLKFVANSDYFSLNEAE